MNCPLKEITENKVLLCKDIWILVRKILFEIEEKHIDNNLVDLEIQGYDLNTVAFHCNILFDAGFLDYYHAIKPDSGLCGFVVGGLTWDGCEFLDKIRSETVWIKTKETIVSKGLPMVLDVVKDVSSSIVSALVKGALGWPSFPSSQSANSSGDREDWFATMNSSFSSWYPEPTPSLSATISRVLPSFELGAKFCTMSFLSPCLFFAFNSSITLSLLA